MSRYTAPIRRVDTARGHHYRDASGQRVPGVTTILDKGLPKPALINWAANATAEYAIDHWDELEAQAPAQRLKTLQGARYAEKDRAARRGTEVHRYAEQLLAGKTVQVPEELAGHVEAYARFVEEFDVSPLHVEFSCVSYRWGYAGTADLCAELTIDGQRVVVLADLKTSRSGIFGETALQLAAYRYADKWVVDGKEQDPTPVDHCVGIHVRADGYDLIPIEVTEAEHKAFLYAMRVGMFADRSRDLVGPPIVAPTVSTYRLTKEQA